MPIRAEVPKAEAVTYIEETFAISSAEMGTFWNQSRAITAYSRNDAGPTALHVRVMRDGYDYSSAHVFCAQDGPNVLAAICFASDGGNLHCSLDPIQNASVEASDWRLRFEIQGSIVPPKLDSEFSSAESVSIDFGKNARISVRIPSVDFGGSIPHWEVLAQDDKTEVDLILYSGNARTFVFDQSFPCAIGLALTVNGDRDLNGVQVRKEDGLLKVEWPAASQAGLMVSCPIFACKQAELPLYYRQVPGNK